MFVVLDMEWIEDAGGCRSLTQLYAARVDERWNAVRSFDALVRPREPPQTQTAKPPLSRQERNERIIANAGYTYLFSPASGVFHLRTCKQLLRVKDLRGTVYYASAAKTRRPCKLCLPDLPVPLDRPVKPRPEKAAAEAPASDEPVSTRLLGNQYALLPPSRIVGCCHNALHPGKLTKQLLKQHDCLGKDCRFFEKYEDAAYWIEHRRQEECKFAKKLARQQKKEQAAAAQAAHQALAAQLQSFAGEAGYAMQIVRVDEEGKKPVSHLLRIGKPVCRRRPLPGASRRRPRPLSGIPPSSAAYPRHRRPFCNDRRIPAARAEIAAHGPEQNSA